MFTQILDTTDTVSDPFKSRVPFVVFLDTYADGWFVQYAVTKETSTDMVWKNWHTHAITENGEGSRILVYGMEGVSYRLNSGTAGATGYRSDVDVSVFN